MEEISQDELAKKFLLKRRDDSQALAHQRRWYDHNHFVSTIIHVLDGISLKKRTELIFYLLEYLQQYRKILVKFDDFSQADLSSTDKVLGLYQSSNKQRWYDQVLGLPKLIDAMSILPEEHYTIILEECIKSADSYYRLYGNGSAGLRDKLSRIIEDNSSMYIKNNYEDIKNLLDEHPHHFNRDILSQRKAEKAAGKNRGFYTLKDDLQGLCS